MEIEDSPKKSRKSVSRQEVIRQEIITDFFEVGLDLEELSHKYRRSVRSLGRIINTYKKRKSTRRKKGSGRKGILSRGAKIGIMNTLRANPYQSCKKMKEDLELECCEQTVANYLHKKKFSYRKHDKKVEMDPEDKDERAEWAEEHKTDDFSNAVFADESFRPS